MPRATAKEIEQARQDAIKRAELSRIVRNAGPGGHKTRIGDKEMKTGLAIIVGILGGVLLSWFLSYNFPIEPAEPVEPPVQIVVFATSTPYPTASPTPIPSPTPEPVLRAMPTLDPGIIRNQEFIDGGWDACKDSEPGQIVRCSEYYVSGGEIAAEMFLKGELK